MKCILLILVIAVSSLNLSAADSDVKKIKLRDGTLRALKRSISRYDCIAEEVGISQDTGLAHIYHVMCEMGAAFTRERCALEKAELFKDVLLKNRALGATLSSFKQGICVHENPYDQISVITQKDILLLMQQLGFPIVLPTGNFDEILAYEPDKESVEQLLKSNTNFPTTPIAVATLRGALIAKYYVLQKCEKSMGEFYTLF